MDCDETQRNERWNPIDTSKRARSSDRLRQILITQDLSRAGSSSHGLDLSSHTMPIPAIRRNSFTSMDSSGSLSSMSSVGSYGSNRRTSFTKRKNSSFKLVRYNNFDSKNSLLSLNSRWKSTPTKSRRNSPRNVNKNRLIDSSLCNKLLSTSPCVSIMSSQSDGRWTATASTKRAIDRPMSLIQRKASHNAIFPPSA